MFSLLKVGWIDMNNNENLRKIFNGESIDGRTLSALKRKGLVNKDGVISMFGMHEIDEYKHVPQIPLADIQSCVGKTIVIEENIGSPCECCGCSCINYYTETYFLSAEKLAIEYNKYAESVNEKLHEWWSSTLDFDVERGFNKNISKQLIHCVKKEQNFIDEYSYTGHILLAAMEGLICGSEKGEFRSSYKYSITDTESEIEEYIFSGGEKIFTLEVDVNR